MNEQNKSIWLLEEAYKEAKKAEKKDEVPIGSIITLNNTIIGRGHNTKENTNDVTGHAEILAIKDAAKTQGDWRLNRCTLYTTLEPCPMCFGAILHARIERVIFGAKDIKWGACGSHVELDQIKTFNHQAKVEFIEYEKGKKILQNFFKKKRNKNTLK